MKRRFKLIAATLVLALGLSTASALACTAVYVGKDASTDGSTIIARSEDQSNGAYNKMFVVVPRVENVPNRFMEDINGCKIALPATTYKYTMVPDNSLAGDGVYPAVCTNEYGVAITATVTAYANKAALKADPLLENGLREAALPAVVACSVKTAREGVERLAQIIATQGSGENNIILIADQQEAWYMEIYTGHQWAAVKMPQDKVAVFGNEFMLDSIDPTNAEDVMYSKDLFTLPEKSGFAVIKDGKMNLLATYSAAREDWANMRTWAGMHLLAPSQTPEYTTDLVTPLFYKPDKKVSPLDVMELMRYRYEGTKLAADLPGNESLYPIGNAWQSDVHIIQLKDKYPKEMAAVQWLAMGNAEHSVFIPSFSDIEDTPDAYKVDGDKYDPNGAYWKFKRLCSLGEQDRKYYGQGVRDVWKFYEECMYANMLKSEDTMIALYNKNPQSARDYVTKLSKDTAQDAFDESDMLFEDLMTYIMDQTGCYAPGDKRDSFVGKVGLNTAATAKGYTVTWTNKNKPIFLSKKGTTYSLTVDSEEYQVMTNGVVKIEKMSSAPTIKKGKTYVPLDFIKTL